MLSCLGDFPLVPLTVGESEENFNYNILDWQRVGAKRMIQHFFNVNNILFIMKVGRRRWWFWISVVMFLFGLYLVSNFRLNVW